MSRRRPLLALTAGVALAGMIAGLPNSQAATPVSKHLLRPLVGGNGGTFPGAEVAVGDADRRGPGLQPTASVRRELASLGSGMYTSWTQYGTPLVLAREGKLLARGLKGSPEQVARTYLRQHAGLYGLSAADVDALELVSADPLSDTTTSFEVILRQKAKGLPLAEDGMVGVGVGSGGRISEITSSLVPTSILRGLGSTTPKLSIREAVLAAARDAGVTSLGLGDLHVADVADAAGFTHVTTPKLHQPQRARLRVLATTDRGARLVWETDVLDVAGGRALATMSYVDARSGAVLLRRDAVDTFAEHTAATPGQRSISTLPVAAPINPPGTWAGAYSKTACSPDIPLSAVMPGDQTMAISAVTTNPNNDIYISVRRNGLEIGSIDTLSSPEAGAVSFKPAVASGDVITGAVCPYDAAGTAPFDFTGNYVTSDVAQTVPALPAPLTDGKAAGTATWRVFGSNPVLTSGAAPDNRYLVCSGQKGDPNPLMKALTGCDYVYTDGSPLPYDTEPIAGAPTFITAGNNAVSTDARASTSLTPGAPFVPPLSPTRDYNPAWTDSWHTSGCDPLSIVGPNQSDILAAITNLFVGHNRAHDYAYRLGLTEPRGALQLSNFEKGGAEGDPELGNAQNAALTDDAFAVSNQGTGPAAELQLAGRNNANQIALQDGVPGITNQYLFQPIPTFHGPCADGDLDSGIFIHEYTHAISNRLIGGPDASISGHQGDSMGESWSDLVAVEYLNAFGLAGSGGEDKFALGVYATGNPARGIRDYNALASKNVLNYSDIGFDSTGPEVHADGEIWNATQMEVRQALIEKYDAQYPSTDKALQKACAVGRTATGAPAPSWDKCPGNRRYITYLFDAMVAQLNPSPSMLDMATIELQKILLRDDGADYDTVADAFARRGLGKGAASVKGGDTDPTPSFASPTASKNANVTFKLVSAHSGKPVKGSVYVGMYSARCVPVATTLGGDNPGTKASLIAGTYTFTVQAKGFGIHRFTQKLTPGSRTLTLKLAQNVASSAYGPDVSGNEGGARLGNALDDSELTDAGWDGLDAERPVAGRSLTVGFPNGKQTVDKLVVSALHHPLQELPEGQTDLQGRFIGVRAFDVYASKDGGATFSKIYTSPADFFPSVMPRPVAPDLIAREITLPKPVTADALKIVIRTNACTGQAAYNKETENDPTTPSSCYDASGYSTTGTTEGFAYRVTLTELQAFKSTSSTEPELVPVTRPRTPGLAATGSSLPMGLAGLVLLGLAGTALAYRRRTA